MTETAATVIRDADWIVAWDATDGRHVYERGGDVAFAGGALVQVGGRYGGPVAEEIPGAGRLVMPGLVDIHSHPTSEPMRKGLLDELGSPRLYMSSLYEFMPIFPNDPEGTVAAVQVALCELMTSGTTTVCDLSVAFDGWLDLLGESGMRVCVAPMFRDAAWSTANGYTVDYHWDAEAGRRAFDRALRTIDLARQHPSGRLSGMVAPSQIDTCTPELIRDAHAEAKARGLPFQIHAAQSMVEFLEMTRRHGVTPIRWLSDLGALDERSIVGHGIFLDHHSWVKWHTDEDLGILARSGAKVAHCPTVFQRRGIALEHFGRYRKAGIEMGIGTDTYPHNMLEEIRSAAYMGRLVPGNVDALKTADLFHAATVGGARALGRDDIGRLAPGCRADLVLVDTTHPQMRPARDPLRSLVYVAAERAVRDVFVDGTRVVRDGAVVAFDHAEAAAALEEAQKRAMERAPGLDWAGRTADELSPLALPVRG